MAYTAQDAALTRRLGIVDSHNDFATTLLKRQHDGDHDSLRTYWLPRFRDGGVKLVFAPIWVSSTFVPEGALRRAVQAVDVLFREVEANADEIEMAYTYADVERIWASGKIGVLLAFEGAEPLGHDLAALRLFHRLGLRVMSLTWSRRNAFGDGAWENESRGGLTRLGRQAIAEMERLGVLVDVSHASDQTARDILSVATRPLIASHSNVRALRDHPRNLPDDVLHGIAASGGTIGVTAVSGFIGTGPATIARWVDHFERVVQTVGIDHVAVGADFCHQLFEMGASLEIEDWAPDLGPRPGPFEGMLSPEDLPGLTAELVRRGFAEPDLRKILHENHLRVLREVLKDS